MTAVTVQGREPRGATQRLLIVYRCGECGRTGVHGEMTDHLHEQHNVAYTIVSKMLGKARYDAAHGIEAGTLPPSARAAVMDIALDIVQYGAGVNRA